MNTLKFSLILASALQLALTSCDNNGIQTDQKGPEIIITSPQSSDGGDYFTGDTIFFEVDITDEDELHEIGISLRLSFLDGLVDSGEVFHVHYHPHESEFHISEKYRIDTANLSDFWFYVEASDHNENESMDSVQVYVEN